MNAEAEQAVRDLVAEIAERLDVETPPVVFAAEAAAVRWDEKRGLRLPTHVVAHVTRFGTVPTAAARDMAFAMAKTAARRDGVAEPTLVEVEALSFAEAFVRDRVLNR